jgi:hypothetical protein
VSKRTPGPVVGPQFSQPLRLTVPPDKRSAPG